MRHIRGDRRVKILVTGSSGMVGSQVVSDLISSGHEVKEFDISTGQNLLDQATLQESCKDCDAIIHSAALLGLPDQSASQIMATNVLGTWNVLAAAKAENIARIVFLSSVDVLGVFKGEKIPDYLPLDHKHPCYPASPYGISKSLAEEMCRHFSVSSNVSVVCLRPPGVWNKDTYHWIQSERSKRTSFEWDPFWEYGAFIDVRDLSSACIRALDCHIDHYSCVLVSSSDITTSGRTGLQLKQFLMPEVEWRGSEVYEADPYRTLIDIDITRQILGWSPQYTWQQFAQK